MTRNFFLKRKIAILTTITLILIFAGCIDSGTNIQKKDGYEEDGGTQVTINWLTRWKDEHLRENLIHEIANEFEFENPNIEVNYQFFQDVGLNSDPDIAEKIVEMINTGNYEWDIVVANTGVYGDVAELLNDSYWGEKYLVDFLEVEGFNETQKSFIIDNYLDEYGGILVGPYIEGFYTMLWYNTEVADEIGIEIKQYGMTFDDLVEYVKAVYEYNQQNGTNIAAFYESNSDWRTTEYMFGHLFKSDIGNFSLVKEETFTEQKNQSLLKTFQAMQELSKYEPLLKGHDNRAWYDTRNMSFDGTVLFTVNGAWMYNHWMDMDENKTYLMTPAELPVFQNVDFYMGSYIPQFAVMKDAPNKDAAIELMKYISTPTIAEKWIRYTKAPTGIKGHLTTSDVADDQFEQFQSEINEKYQGRLHFSDNAGYILGEENKLVDSLIDELMIDVLDGEITAEQAHAQVLENME